MPTRIYRSNDPGAPPLTGEADTLNALLQACLVDGYGSQPAAGWSSPYYDAASRTRVFRQANAGLYLQVQDNGQAAGGLREARLRGWEAMTAHDTGAGPFPTATQRANGYCCRKSATANNTVRAWTLAADERRFYLLIETGDAAGTTSLILFGDIRSYRVNDSYACIISGRIAENSSSLTTTQEAAQALSLNLTSVSTHHLARSSTGVGAAVPAGIHTDNVKGPGGSAGFVGKSGMAYPAPVDGGLYLGKVWVHENGALRGELPGFWAPLHPRPLGHGDTFQGVTGLTGKAFQALYTGADGEAIIETSDTWDL